MQLTDKQDLLIKNFSEILIYGNICLSKAEMHPIKTRTKKFILFYSMGAAQSYSEAIFKLIKPDNIYDKAAEVLFRSLVELYINLNYIYCKRKDENALIFMIESVKDKIDFAKKHKTLWEKYPDWSLRFGTIRQASDWDKFISDQEKIIAGAEKKYRNKIPASLNIVDRAIAFDINYKKSSKLPKHIVLKKLEKKSLEKYYVLYYKYLSQLSHLTMPGLEQFMKRDKSGRFWLEIDGKPSDIESIIPVTFIIYFTILNHFLKQFKLYNKVEFQKYKDIIKSMKD